MPIVKKLELFWKKAQTTLKWKLNVYNAVVVTKLIYGLETLQFTEAQGRVLDTFQQRGLRKILNIPPTYIDRSHTNADVLRIANETKQWTPTSGRVKIIPLTEVLKKKKLTLL